MMKTYLFLLVIAGLSVSVLIHSLTNNLIASLNGGAALMGVISAIVEGIRIQR